MSYKEQAISILIVDLVSSNIYPIQLLSTYHSLVGTNTLPPSRQVVDKSVLLSNRVYFNSNRSQWYYS